MSCIGISPLTMILDRIRDAQRLSNSISGTMDQKIARLLYPKWQITFPDSLGIIQLESDYPLDRDCSKELLIGDGRIRGTALGYFQA